MDVTKEAIPVIPTVHYNMGGIPTNWKGQVLNFSDNKDEIVRGLWAAGEAACSSVHGANRLGANSLLDIVVFGKACAENIANGDKYDANTTSECDLDAMNDDIEKYCGYKSKTGKLGVADLRLEMQKVMQNHAGVFRNDKLLQSGVEKMEELYSRFPEVYIDDKSDDFNSEYVEMLELKKSIR